MQSIEAVRERRSEIEDSLKRRKQLEKLDQLDIVITKHDEWKEVKGMLDSLRHERNKVSEAINQAKKKKEDASTLIEQARSLPAKIKEVEALESELDQAIQTILQDLPNTLHPDVPTGDSEEENVEREVIGEKTKLPFSPKNHAEILEQLGLADFESARRVAGSGFYYLKGSLALLDQALQQFAIKKLVDEGFTLVVPPYMTRHAIAAGMTDLAFFDETMFKIEEEDLFPIPTSEFPLVGMLFEQDIDEREAPMTLSGVSPCFRKEVGAHGIDEKGLYRVHQFHKIEQVVVCEPEQSEEYFDTLMRISKELFTELGLPIRVLEMCTGDLGDMKYRQFDLEVYSPRRNGYFEVGSCSNLTDAQARRLGIRFIRPDGTRYYPHTLNNTAIATSRAIVAIVENFQNEDGSVDIPKALHPYMHGITRLEKL